MLLALLAFVNDFDNYVRLFLVTTLRLKLNETNASIYHFVSNRSIRLQFLVNVFFIIMTAILNGTIFYSVPPVTSFNKVFLKRFAH